MPLFHVIDLFPDETARGGPEQMALDEAMLEGAERPVLRVYRWSAKAVSFGYSQSLAAVKAAYPSLPAVRRWTGGGIVEHGFDWTFSLVVPAGAPLANARPEDTYRTIHSHVTTVLNQIGYSARLAKLADCAEGNACFSSPVVHDVIGPTRRKFCGGAQRRTRKGFLHQGSIQNLCPPADFAVRLVSLMALEAQRYSPGFATLTRTRELIARKYSTIAWLEKVS
jgi:lipoyl(octanoyl) transferase